MLNIEAFRQRARKVLPADIFDFVEGGAEDEVGLDHNRRVFESLRFRARRMVDVSRVELSTTMLGRRLPLPLVTGPLGLCGLLWPKGDIAVARACAKKSIPYVLSTASNASIEDVARESDGDCWFQLYPLNEEVTASLTNRARLAGYSTLVVTVDVPANGNRERDRRNGFTPTDPPVWVQTRRFLQRPRWAWRMSKEKPLCLANLRTDGNTAHEAALLDRTMDKTFDWVAFKRIRDAWPGRLVLKGLLRSEDLVEAASAGVNAVVLSNHGGRQLDFSISPMTCLSKISRPAGLEVMIDSGFRRGSDVVKALSLGASAVMLGRSVAYGLAANGEQGVLEVLDIFQREIELTLMQIGCTSVSSLSPDYIE